MHNIQPIVLLRKAKALSRPQKPKLTSNELVNDVKSLQRFVAGITLERRLDFRLYYKNVHQSLQTTKLLI